MKPKPLGIIGGAGPLAGSALFDKIIRICEKKYGCHRDADYPKIILLSFPFSEMLIGYIDADKIRQELKRCLMELRQKDVVGLAIACNTLHAFLDQEDVQEDFIHLTEATKELIPPGEIPLVLCTSMSTQAGLHKKFFPCSYPSRGMQVRVDHLIDQILKEGELPSFREELASIIRAQTENTIVLGCSELSLFADALSLHNQVIIDPLDIAAEKLLIKSFGK